MNYKSYVKNVGPKYIVMVEEILTQNRFVELLENNRDTDKILLIDFFASWCGPCKMIAPKLDVMTKKYPDIHFCKISTEKEDFDKIIKLFDIVSLPTFCLFKGDKYKNKLIGADLVGLEQMIIKYSTDTQINN